MISIIIPTLFEEKYIENLLKSISKQRYSDYEVIVVDAYSKDKTEKIALKYGAKFVEMFGRNTSKQRNNGAKMAQGDLLLFIDADVVLRNPKILGIVSGYFNNNTDLVAASCNIKILPEEAKFVDRMMYSIFNSFIRLCLYFKIGAGMGAFQVVRAKKFLGYDENKFIAEDVDLIKRIIKKGKIHMFNFNVYTSARRVHKEGYWKIIKNWIFKSKIQRAVR